MSDIAIKVQNISKRYRIGLKEEVHDTLAGVVTDFVRSPFKNLRRLRRLTQFSENGGDPEDIIWALKDVSFEVERGEVVGIIGANGAGKSTLLKILSRITHPTNGWVKLNGRVSSLLEVGTGFHPELTGRENIYLNGTILGMTKAEVDRKFDEIVDFSGVEKFIDTPVKFYSSGMRVRLAFSVAAHLEPEILLVDEVLAVGDIAFQKKCLGKMENVAMQGRTVLFVSHSMGAIRKLCPYSILLDNGKIKAIGQSNDVIDEYLELMSVERTVSVLLPPEGVDGRGIGKYLRFYDSNHIPSAYFQLRESWYIRFEFEIYEYTPHVIAAVALVNSNWITIITYWSKPRDLAPGKYYVEFKNEIPLKACDLKFKVGLSSHERAFYNADDVEGRVSVSHIAKGRQPIRSAGSGLLLSEQISEIQKMN